MENLWNVLLAIWKNYGILKSYLFYFKRISYNLLTYCVIDTWAYFFVILFDNSTLLGKIVRVVKF